MNLTWVNSLFHIVLIIGDVSLKDLIKWTQKTFETLSVQADQFAVAFSNDVGGSWFISKKCKFSEVIAKLIVHN